MGFKSFLKETLMMTFTSIIINAAGIGFRSYLTGKIGADGIGLYSLVMSVGFFAAAVANSGISLSVVRLISENTNGKRRDSDILCCAASIAAVLGIFSAGALFFSAQQISIKILDMPSAAQPMRLFALSLPFAAISACITGYFMAKRRIGLCIKWQLMDEALKICLTTVILNAVPNCTAQSGCTAIALAAAVAEVLSCGYGFLLYDSREAADFAKTKQTLLIYKDIAKISIPTALSSYFRSILTTLENVLIPKCLAKLSNSKNSALAEFGVLKGMAMPTVSFPLILMSSAASLLIPELANSVSLKDYQKVRKICRVSITASVVYSMCAALCFGVLGPTLGGLLFDSAECGHIISVLAFSVPFMYLDALADAILKALNQQVASMKYNAAEGIVRIALIYMLVPRFGSAGFMAVIFASNFISAFLGLNKIYSVLNAERRYINPRMRMKTVRVLGK